MHFETLKLSGCRLLLIKFHDIIIDSNDSIIIRCVLFFSIFIMSASENESRTKNVRFLLFTQKAQ